MYFKRISDLQPVTDFSLDSMWVEVSQSFKYDNDGYTIENTGPSPFEPNFLGQRNTAVTAFETLDNADAFVSKRMCLAEILRNITHISVELADLSYITSYYIEGKQEDKTLIFNSPYGPGISSLQHISASTLTGYWPSDVSALTSYPTMVVNDTGVTAKHLHVPGEAVLTAAAAYWADLAELYKSDEKYEPGTLVKFGGEEEITIADDNANAVVTEKPAFLMNLAIKDDEKALGVVLTGRSKVRTVGKIYKFDKLVLSKIPGVATKKSFDNEKIIGIALENNEDEEEKLVEAVLKMKF